MKLIQKYQTGGFTPKNDAVDDYIANKSIPVMSFMGKQFSRLTYPFSMLWGWNDRKGSPIAGINDNIARTFTNTGVPMIIKINPIYQGYHGLKNWVSALNNDYSNSFETQNSSNINQQKASTETTNRKFKINPNFDINKLKKNGGIIKALNGIKIVRKIKDGRYEIVSNDDKGYFFDPSTQLLTDNKGNQGLFTTYDLTQLFKVNPEFAKNLVDAGYSFTKSGAAGDHNTTDLVQAIYNSYVPKKNITESTNVNERPNITAQKTPPAQVVPPVQSSQQGFTPEQFFDTLFGNQEYAKKFKQFLGIPDTSTEPEIVGKQPEAPTYESLVKVNTTAFNNGMNSASWRRNFRKSFNNALLNGDMYGINPNGSQVFDINGMNVSEMIQNIGGLDPRKGLTRRGMRLLKKQQKAYNGNIFENVNTKVRTLPFQEISNQELDSLGQDALPQFQVHNHGLDVPFMNPTYEESDEGDIVNIGTKNIPFYQEVKRQ